MFEEWIQGSNNAPVNVEMGALGARFLSQRWQHTNMLHVIPVKHPYLKHWPISITKSGKFNGNLINPKVSHPDPLGIGRCIWTTMLVPRKADTSGFCVVSLRRPSQVGIWGCKFKTSKDYYITCLNNIHDCKSICFTLFEGKTNYNLHDMHVYIVWFLSYWKDTQHWLSSRRKPRCVKQHKVWSWVQVFDQQRNLKHDSFLQFQKVQGVICGIGDVVRGRHWSREE